MKTYLIVIIVASVLLTTALILYFTGVFSGGGGGDKDEGPVEEPQCPHPTTPPTTLEVIKISNDITDYNWAEYVAWPPGKYTLVEADGYSYWKHARSLSLKIIYKKENMYLSGGSPDQANPEKGYPIYGAHYGMKTVNDNPNHIYEEYNENTEVYRFKIKPC